jgi:putative spermidine/putrescine transport system permease protein
MTNRSFVLLCLIPLLIFSIVFLALPLVRLFLASGESEIGWSIYLEILRKPRYLNTLVLTVLVSLATTVAALAVSTIAGMFLSRNQFKGRGILLSIMTLPLAFPGVVIGFLIILLGGRQGLINQITPGHVVFAYSVIGLFLGYLYFSIPRVLLTVMAAAEKLDTSLEEAARTMGASSYRVVVDVILPGLMPSLIAAGAIAFATAMGAFGNLHRIYLVGKHRDGSSLVNCAGHCHLGTIADCPKHFRHNGRSRRLTCSNQKLKYYNFSSP